MRVPTAVLAAAGSGVEALLSPVEAGMVDELNAELRDTLSDYRWALQLLLWCFDCSEKHRLGIRRAECITAAGICCICGEESWVLACCMDQASLCAYRQLDASHVACAARSCCCYILTVFPAGLLRL
jgi:hypothetical protein